MRLNGPGQFGCPVDHVVDRVSGRRGRFARAGARRRGGFSLIELLTVITVALVLTALLMPALGSVQENLKRVVCSSNMRQIGLGIMMYAKDDDERLPFSDLLHMRHTPRDLIAAHRGEDPHLWDNLGRLYSAMYIGTPDVFYCPSHTGQRTIDDYREYWLRPKPGLPKIYTNYLYCGHRRWESADPAKRALYRSLTDNALVLAVDGFHSPETINHRDGVNVVRGDGSVRWLANTQDFTEIMGQVGPQGDLSPAWRYLAHPHN